MTLGLRLAQSSLSAQSFAAQHIASPLIKNGGTLEPVLPAVLRGAAVLLSRMEAGVHLGRLAGAYGCCVGVPGAAEMGCVRSYCRTPQPCRRS